MSNIDKRALREAAEKALSAGDGNWQTWREAGMNYPEIFTSSGHIVATVNGSFAVVRSDFIAAANPATVLALLDELEAAESGFPPLTVERLMREKDALEKRIAELEAREKSLRTVGVMSQKAFQRLEGRESRFIALWPRPEIYLPRKRPEDGVIVYARVAGTAKGE